MQSSSPLDDLPTCCGLEIYSFEFHLAIIAKCKPVNVLNSQIDLMRQMIAYPDVTFKDAELNAVYAGVSATIYCMYTTF